MSRLPEVRRWAGETYRNSFDGCPSAILDDIWPFERVFTCSQCGEVFHLRRDVVDEDDPVLCPQCVTGKWQ